ncbi:murein transglycosylase domain-containing protein [Thiomicrorhabdus sp. zzn3]|uniref:murein transglycosylase domain-containing protein n=1 Tax=Thiomicrorhabdus sp. zzn3 TaxID=3039775 RepID=UPI00243674C6|nr:murein transglycosylase domain-containing protein [Thiomicrorhabdus sp. zzn3]MDG6777605.1 murein transglycosylase domain-containing protein [Thiomicrorhabdus sp. zzn3]
MKLSNSLFSILIASGLLLFAAGSALSGFQNWVQYQAVKPQKALVEAYEVTGIRLISSTSLPADERKSGSSIQVAVSDVKKPTPVVVEPLTENDSTSQATVQHESLSAETTESSSVNASPLTEVAPLQPTVVMYENELVVEFPESIATKALMKRAIARLLLSDDPFSEDLLGRGSLTFQNRPHFYRQVLDQNRKPIKYPVNAFEYADYLLKSEHLEKLQDEEGSFVAVSIPLVSPSYPKPVEQYQHWVSEYAQTFKVDPALVFAVMETESRFKPDAVSRSNALGLMQLKAATAGRDIYQYIDQKPGMPKPEELFDEQNNIRMGTAYLGLLKHEYLADVRNPQNKELLSIASYNGGLSTVLKLFGQTPEQAVKSINQLHPRQVYRKLRFEHASKETREYLDKVLKAKDRYQQILSA